MIECLKKFPQKYDIISNQTNFRWKIFFFKEIAGQACNDAVRETNPFISG
jgi:hypothetical protein